ncbi:MAG TPA: acyl-CoA dehydrogenase family protein [Streptosporangiaceae bacterium]|nr:acyl-CoA dehydrogenase family protein [Streptosporangiaceae bacterium]
MAETGEQRALREAVRGLLARHQAQDDDQRLWRRLAGIGVAGLAVPERFGGAGAGPAEVHVVQEELGRSLARTPMLGSAVLATVALLRSGDEAACARLLPAMADGTAIAALAWTTAAGRWDPAEVACRATATPDGGWSIDGESQYVLDGDIASVLLVPALMAEGAIGLFEIDPGQPGATVAACASMDQTRRLASVRLERAAGCRIGAQAPLGLVRDLGCIALSSEQAGAAARALEITVEYATARVQFGRPIGSFQALAHRMADLHVLVQAARSVSQAAAEAASRGAADLPLRAATAKAYCSEALQQVAAEMLQMHGAIGMTWEHDAHRYFKRAHGAAMLLGRPATHVERIAAAVIDC